MNNNIFLIFKDGIVNLADVVSISRAGETEYIYVLFRAMTSQKLFKVFHRDCHSETKGQPRDLLACIYDIATNSANRKNRNLPLCIGLFGNGNGDIEVDLVDFAHCFPDRYHSIFKWINANSIWHKFFVGFINPFRNRLKTFGNKFFKFHKPNSFKDTNLDK